MSYIRPLENSASLYIYPEDGCVRFMSFPEHSNEVFPDEMLDILFARMTDKELLERKKHGGILLKTLDDGDFESYRKLKNFY